MKATDHKIFIKNNQQSLYEFWVEEMQKSSTKGFLTITRIKDSDQYSILFFTTDSDVWKALTQSIKAVLKRNPDSLNIVFISNKGEDAYSLKVVH